MKGKPLPEYRLDDVRTLFDVLPKGLQTSGMLKSNANYNFKW